MDTLNIERKDIDTEKAILYLKATGQIEKSISNNKLRIIVVFRNGENTRRFPVDAKCKVEEKSHITQFDMNTEIELENVFQDIENTGEDIKVSFCYCAADGSWNDIGETFELAENLFEKPKQRKSIIKTVFSYIGFFVCTLFMPVWIIDGVLVMKGIKKPCFKNQAAKGKKIIFYQAHGRVKKLTGHGYSPREIKTGYFEKCYYRAVKKIKNPENLVFLSERYPDKGGNLDLVRSELKNRGYDYEECIDTRPIHKLPFSQIKKAANLAAGAGVIVLEDFYPQINVLRLRKETELVQLWHACGAFKMFGLSELGKVENLEQSTRNHRNYTLAFTSGTAIAPFYSEAFGIPDYKVEPLGVPRTDVFFQKGYEEKVSERLFEKYPEMKGKKIVLFAPTFRGSGKNTAFYPKEKFSVNKFMENAPEDVFLIVKHHPFVKQQIEVSDEYKNRVMDLTGKENINDILFITSLLITDYSSSVFEAALLKIPMMFYTFDLDEYMVSRDMYFDFESFAPGKIVKTEEELHRGIVDLLEKNEMADDEKLEKFCGYFLDALDGNSTKRIADRLEICLKKA